MTDRDLGPETLPDALSALGSQLELLGASPLTIAVCGGSALNALGLVARTTRDVDVLGLVDIDPRTVSPGPLPERFWEAARRCLQQDPSEAFEGILRDMLRKLGFEHVEREL
jgi:hypothetical protein